MFWNSHIPKIEKRIYRFHRGLSIMSVGGETGMLKIEFAYMTHPGRIRKKNQDNLICIRDYLSLNHDRTEEPVTGTAGLSSPLLFGVFDGMGGEDHGEVAAYLAAKTAAGREAADGKDLDLLCREMNSAVCRYAAEHHLRSTGTTASLLLFDKRGVTSCHIGDSRIYRWRDGVAEQLTKDDIWPYYQGKKAPLLQCLGIPEDEMRIRPHIDWYPADPEAVYIICSDGLSDMIGQKQIAEALSGNAGLKEKMQLLMDKALEQGGRDNITIILNRLENR